MDSASHRRRISCSRATICASRFLIVCSTVRLAFSLSRCSVGGEQLTLAAINKSGRKMLSVNCERRMSSGYTAGVLVNRLKKRLDAAEKTKR